MGLALPRCPSRDEATSGISRLRMFWKTWLQGHFKVPMTQKRDVGGRAQPGATRPSGGEAVRLGTARAGLEAGWRHSAPQPAPGHCHLARQRTFPPQHGSSARLCPHNLAHVARLSTSMAPSREQLGNHEPLVECLKSTRTQTKTIQDAELYQPPRGERGRGALPRREGQLALSCAR